jgi:K+-transporting ATPase A subunit
MAVTVPLLLLDKVITGVIPGLFRVVHLLLAAVVVQGLWAGRHHQVILLRRVALELHQLFLALL